MIKTSYIYKVEFLEPPYFMSHGDTTTDFYFSSLAAIYERFTSKQVGCGVHHLWSLKISDGNVYNGKRCDIRRVELVGKANSTPKRQ